MNPNEKDPPYSVVRRLGRLLSDDRGAAVLAALQLALSENNSLNWEIGASEPCSEPDLVGIWGRDPSSGSFARQERFRSEYRCWAANDSIPKKKPSTPRILLIGESAARGYLYDPLFTPALLLQTILNHWHPSAGGFEVVDLACVDIDAFQLVTLIHQSRLLDPDAIVLWAGNNWLNVRHFTWREIEFLIDRVDQGYRFWHRLFYRRVLPRVARRVLRSMAELCDTIGVPGVLLIPEFNLADWEDESSALLPYLPSSTHIEWEELYDDAAQAISAHRPDIALPLTDRLHLLGEGLCPGSHRLRAQALEQLGRQAEAEESLILARDAVCGLPIQVAPRCPRPVQVVFRNDGPRQGLDVVDLPLLFRHEAAGGTPDNRFFLDYCHLNLRGMQIAVEATAKCLLRRWRRPPMPSLPSPDFSQAALQLPTSLDQAISHLLAAVHNAHWGQSQASIESRCQLAAQTDTRVRRIMAQLLDFQNRRAARWLCKSFAEVSVHPIINRYLHPRNPNEWDKFADYGLNRALLAALEDPGYAELLDNLLISEHSPIRGSVDLLQYQYRAPTFPLRDGRTMGATPAFVQFTERRARFSLAADREHGPVRLTMTYRIPIGTCMAHSVCRLVFNGRILLTLPITSSWRDFDVLIPISDVQRGHNDLMIIWPPQVFSWYAHRDNGVPHEKWTGS